ncbi:hypothetical protein B296_00014651 [Ensete ventricosum]|uniref:Uncharacterized protein n=1 Tax=Ensete ventricosum TaxID=4639 RepID=A0A426XGL0_ENSVE|nr:hypothetical protein B296_00014651 [Ensete ventricosum]
MNRLGRFSDKGLGLEGWLRVVVYGNNRFEGRFRVDVGGSNWFSKVRWLRKIKIGGWFDGPRRPLFGLRFWLWILEIGYDSCILRL